MTSYQHKTAVGAFVLGGLVLLVISIIMLGGGRLFSNNLEYVLYFDGSVSGLSTGAPVVFRGLPMGSVTDINLVTSMRDSSVTIPVYVRIDEDNFERTDEVGITSEEEKRKIVRRMVQRGLRARLQMQSLITGQYRIELDFYPSSPASFRSARPDTEIPTLPSPIDTLQSTIARLPLEQMVTSLSSVLQDLSRGLANDKLGKALDSFTATFDEAKILLDAVRANAGQALQKLDTVGSSLEKDLTASMTSFREAMQRMSVAADHLRVATVSAQGLLGRDSPVLGDFRRLLKESTDTIRALRSLADMLERNPEALLKGKRGAR